LEIYEAEVKSSSSASTSTQNIAFVSSQTTDSTNDQVSAIASVSAASAKNFVFALPNVDTMSNAASTFPQKVTTAKAPMVNAVKGVQGNWEVQVSNGLGSKEKLTILFLVKGNPQHALKDKGVINSGCSRHMTGDMSYLSDFEQLNGDYVAFSGNPKGGKIFGNGKIRTEKLDFDDVYYVKEIKFNLFSVSQMCDKKKNILFTDTECLVLSPEFKLLDENQVLLRVPRENNMYNVDLKNIVPSGDLTCLFAKATLDESNLWHRRMGHIYFKTMNKLVKGNLVRGLSTKVFENNHTCVACKKGKERRASCKTKSVSSVIQPDRGLPALFALAGKKKRKALNDQYNRCSKKLSRVISPMWLE
nr:ribonuclease H-like domain-containing protein [Tanacetum cinerariifolium]